MFLQPKKSKFKKVKKGKLKNYNFKSNNELKFGEFGLKARQSGTISSRQIEAARKAIVRKIKRKGKVWICIFPHTPVTNKPVESRMGKGKGSVDYWVAKVSKGTTIFEVCGVSSVLGLDALISGGKKLPVKTKFFD